MSTLEKSLPLTDSNGIDRVGDNLLPSMPGLMKSGTKNTIAGRDVNCLLTGGSRLLQEGVIQLLEETRFVVRDAVDDLEQAIRLLKEEGEHIDLVVAQLIGTGDHDPLERIREIKSLLGDKRLIILAWRGNSPSFLVRAFETGADGYLETDMSPEGFRQSLGLVMVGEKVFPTRMASMLTNGTIFMAQGSNRASQQRGTGPSFNDLSDREVEILRLLAGGRPNKVIAMILEITEATVKVHVKAVLRKLRASNRTQAAIWAIRHGLAKEEAEI